VLLRLGEMRRPHRGPEALGTAAEAEAEAFHHSISELTRTPPGHEKPARNLRHARAKFRRAGMLFPDGESGSLAC